MITFCFILILSFVEQTNMRTFEHSIVQGVFQVKAMSLLEDFISLFFPRICYACGNSLYKNEEVICTYCRFRLPKTNFHLEADNAVSRLFWGRVKIDAAASFCYYRKEGKVQNLIHHYKYKGKREIGPFLGRLYGGYLRNASSFQGIDLIIPVPLHPKKLRKRGYNQSELFGKGLAEAMVIPLEPQHLYRTVASNTQTKKSRYRRWENVENIFAVNKPDDLRGKHILLVDDVVTTGSTLEACAQTLLQIEGVKVSVVTMAYAVM